MVVLLYYMPMSKWEKLFTYTLLSRGKELYENGNVREYSDKGGLVTAYVVDATKKYQVRATMMGNIVTGINSKCSCQKEYCKHVAAFLYKTEEKRGDLQIEEKEKTTEKEKKKEPSPEKSLMKLHMDDDGEPHYISFASSLDIYKPTVETYRKAKKAFDNDGVYVNSTIIETKNDEKVLAYSTTVSIGSERADVDIELGNNGIRKITCVDGSYSWYYRKGLIKPICGQNTPGPDGHIDLCVHKTAALLSLISYIEKNRDITDFTDEKAVKLITDFRRDKKHLIEDDENEDIDIEPILDGDTIILKAKTDNGKYYKVRNIAKFYSNYLDGYYSYVSGDYGVAFSNSNLTERAKAVMNLIKAAGSFCFANDINDYYDRTTLKDNLPFTSFLDDFYSIMKDTGVIYNGVNLTFRECEPTLEMRIDARTERDKLVGIKVEGNISGRWESEDYIYWTDGRYFNRTEREKLGSAMSLASTADENGHFSFTIGLGYIENFYQRLLPELRRYGKIEDNAESVLSGMITEPPKTIFYIDSDSKAITCKTVLLYEGKEYQVHPRSGYYRTLVAKENPKLLSYGDDIDRDLGDIFPVDYFSGGVWGIRTSETEEIYTFLTKGLKALSQLGEVRISDSVKNMTVRKMPEITGFFDIDENNAGILDLKLDLQGFTIEELIEILQSYKSQKKYHRLENGDFISLSNVNLDSLTSLFLDSGLSIKEFASGKMNLPLYRALYLDQILKEQNGITYSGGQGFKKLIDEFNTINELDYAVPQSLEETMRPYQKDGYRWLRVLLEHGFGGILADDMGLGKTIQTLSLLLSMKEEGKPMHALIITPASLVYNWKAEVKKFTPSLEAVTVTGSAKERAEIIKNNKSWDILITSYDLLKRDIAHYEGISFDIEIIDEAQFIKNHNTAAAKSVRAVNATSRIALTGTPIENRLSELWSIFEYLMPGFLFSQEVFKREISSPIEKTGDKDAALKLKKLTGPFILRRLKTDVLKDLPEKTEETRVTPLEGEQLKLYTAEVAKTKGMLKKYGNYNEKKIEILAELTKIRQICCDPALLYKNYKGGSAKREAVMDLIHSAIDGGHRILLFSQFTSMLELLEKDLKDNNIEYYKITGETAKAKRLELVDSFNNGTTPLFLISLKAGGTGLNLVGADIVIHYDPWWNTAVENQATDRAHRIGQTRQVTVYKMIAQNTIEENIVKLQEAKKNLADEIVTTENTSLSTLSKEDLMELLSITNIE